MKYIKFLKKNTILLVNDKLNERDQLLTKKNMLIKNMEDIKIKEENVSLFRIFFASSKLLTGFLIISV